jgi:hypothetical protein
MFIRNSKTQAMPGDFGFFPEPPEPYCQPGNPDASRSPAEARWRRHVSTESGSGWRQQKPIPTGFDCSYFTSNPGDGGGYERPAAPKPAARASMGGDWRRYNLRYSKALSFLLAMGKRLAWGPWRRYRNRDPAFCAIGQSRR